MFPYAHFFNFLIWKSFHESVGEVNFRLFRQQRCSLCQPFGDWHKIFAAIG